MTFIKGQSGNPAGRPKGIKPQRQRIIDGLKKHCDVDAEELFTTSMHDAVLGGDPAMLRLLGEWLHGKPHATSEVTNTNLNHDLSADDVRERLTSTELGSKMLKLVDAKGGKKKSA